MTPKGAKFNGALTLRVKRMPHLPNPSPGPALESDHFGSNLSHYAVALGKSLFFLCFHYLICKMGMMVVSLIDDSTIHEKCLAQCHRVRAQIV